MAWEQIIENQGSWADELEEERQVNICEPTIAKLEASINSPKKGVYENCPSTYDVCDVFYVFDVFDAWNFGC